MAYRNQAYQLQMKGDKARAIEGYQKAIALDSTYPAPHNDLGVLYEEMGDFDKAERHYLKALQLDPNYVSGYSNLALLYERQGKMDRAVQFWEKRVDLGDPDDAWTVKARERLAVLQPDRYAPPPAASPKSRSERMADAERPFPGTAEPTGDALDLYRVGLKEYRKANYPEAWEAFKRALEQDPQNAKISEYMDRSLEQMKRVHKQVLDQKEDNLAKMQTERRFAVAEKIEDHYVMGKVYFKRGDYSRAKTEFEQILVTLHESDL
ncbi:MAG: tetratricopeptide repeat protein [Candidatus Omnitrophica bacterium]|nr:tetratricopeptide repeat protein [Candidatus Omnitrophota bacterium]